MQETNINSNSSYVCNRMHFAHILISAVKLKFDKIMLCSFVHALNYILIHCKRDDYSSCGTYDWLQQRKSVHYFFGWLFTRFLVHPRKSVSVIYHHQYLQNRKLPSHGSEIIIQDLEKK